MAITNAPGIDRPISAPPQAINLSGATMGEVPKPPAITSTSSTPGPSTSGLKAMQLGTRRTQVDIAADILADEWEDGFETQQANSSTWQDGDLMDVNADADDWSSS